MAASQRNDRGQTIRGAAGDSVPTQTAILRKVAFVAVLTLLFATPMFLMAVSISRSIAAHDTVLWLTEFWFPIQGAIAVWATLDAATVYSLIGPRPDPLGTKALVLSALGVTNVVALFVFLLLMSRG